VDIAPPRSPPLLAGRDVTRRFGGVVAVDAVDLRVSPGEVVGLLGANGAGKTTLIRLCLGLLHPSSGAVELFGRPPSRRSRLRLGYVPQGLGLWDDLTVAENLAFSARAFGTAVPTLEPELAAAAGTVVRDLPLGLQRRLAFAVALAHEPELLVLDEPTSGVDPIARDRLWRTVHAAAEAGAGVLATTHYLEEASYCDRLVIMAAGRVVAAGALADVVGEARAVEIVAPDWVGAFAALEDAGLPSALTGTTLRVPGEDVARVRAVLAARDVAADMRTVPASLEETFVRLTMAADDERGGGDHTREPAA
jgi:ABC-2 type transport system ATP-binding protein/ribosome-dependent ATPase